MLGETSTEESSPGLSTVWARLDCSEQNFESMVDKLPENLNLVVLQHSPDGREIVAAVIGETRAVARMRMPPAVRKELADIVKGLNAWRVTLAKMLLQYCDDAGADGDFETAVCDNEVEDNDASEADFNALIQRMNTLLAPLARSPALNLAFGGFGESGEPAGCVGKEVMIFADRSLSALPLEALSIFEGAKSLARDFSLHMLYHRIMEGSVSGPDGERTPKDNVHIVTEAQMGMVIDPRSEDRSPGDDSPHPRATVGETWAETAKSTAKWQGIVGPTDHIASGQEWQTIMQTRDGGGVVYYGMGRALSYCSPSLVAGLSLSGCKMLVLLDRAENDASNRCVIFLMICFFGVGVHMVKFVA